MQLYIAGPMSPASFGYDHTPEGWDYNYSAFMDATARLDAAGFAVQNPAAGGQVEGWGWADYMRRGLNQLLLCEAVAVLSGWSGSRGASLEVRVARELGMPVQSVEGWLRAG